jgi:hypothetical protein
MALRYYIATLRKWYGEKLRVSTEKLDSIRRFLDIRDRKLREFAVFEALRPYRFSQSHRIRRAHPPSPSVSGIDRIRWFGRRGISRTCCTVRIRHRHSVGW